MRSADPNLYRHSHNRDGRATLAIAGVIAGLLGLVALAVGGGIVAFDAKHRNADGFYTTEARQVTTPTYAFVSDRLDVDSDGPDWLFRDGRLGTISVTATGTDARPVFVGIATSTQVGRYLGRVQHEQVTDFDVNPFTIDSVLRPGNSRPLAPATRHFWARSVSGGGTQSLTWPLQHGDWEVVVINADGSRGVRTSLTVGARVPAVLWLGRGLLTVGGLLALSAAVAFVAGLRRPRQAGVRPSGSLPPDTSPLDATH